MRIITINNGIDSINKQESGLIPFLNIMNECYDRDTSGKDSGDPSLPHGGRQTGIAKRALRYYRNRKK